MRNRREERQERRGGPLGGGGDKTHYQMREKLVSIGDDFWIENNKGEKVFKVGGRGAGVQCVFPDSSPARSATGGEGRDVILNTGAV